MTTYFFDTEYCAKEISIEYKVIPGEDDFNSPGHICDGGGSGPTIEIENVRSDAGFMLYTDRKLQEWYETIETYVCDNYGDFLSDIDNFDDYSDNYM